MRLRLSTWIERVRSSLFLVPTVSVLIAFALAMVSIRVDARFDNTTDLPLGLASTVDSARAVLTAVAGATITFASIAFSVSLLIIQQTSTQFSPRVVHTLFRDPFNKRIMGIVVGTFTYCLVVLRSVRSSLEEGGQPVIPNVSVGIAVVLGVVTILAIVAFIDHSAHTMDVSTILEDVQDEALEQVCDSWREADPSAAAPDHHEEAPDDAYVVRFATNGWVQEIDLESIQRHLPDGATAWIEAYAGRYAIVGTPLCALSAPPDSSTEDAIRSAVVTGETRTMQQDVSFGVRQLADVALKALSPGINDPTTAQDAIFHQVAVMAELLRRDPPAAVRLDDRGRRLVLRQQPDHADLVELAFGETRRAAASQPAVCIYLLQALFLLREALVADGKAGRVAPLDHQARLVVLGAAQAGLIDEDLEGVRQAHDKRFGPTAW